MTEIKLWKDKEARKIDYKLYSDQAEALAMDLTKDNKENKKVNKRSQIRKFYDEVLRLDTEARGLESKDLEEKFVLARLHLLIAKATYARGRDLVSNNFVKFIKSGIEQVHDPDDLKIFTTFFEALMGFYRLHGPAN
jgi:CRISPR-associated protein Csm2